MFMPIAAHDPADADLRPSELVVIVRV